MNLDYRTVNNWCIYTFPFLKGTKKLNKNQLILDIITVFICI